MKKIYILLFLLVIAGLATLVSNHVYSQNKIKSFAPENPVNDYCVSWSDGCNTCYKTPDGITECTERACIDSEYKTETCSAYSVGLF